MSRGRAEDGFTLVELVVSLGLLSMVLGGVAGLMVQSSQINRAEQMSAEVQSNARNCLSMIVQTLRSAGWDPRNVGFASVVLDPSPSNTNNYIEVLADLNEDADTSDTLEDVTIRWASNRIEWRTDPSQPYVILADSISNDADGDGVAETMFVADSMSSPTRITVRITARSPVPDPRSGQYIRYTVSSEVVLRKAI